MLLKGSFLGDDKRWDIKLKDDSFGKQSLNEYYENSQWGLVTTSVIDKQMSWKSRKIFHKENILKHSLIEIHALGYSNELSLLPFMLHLTKIQNQIEMSV